MKKKVWIPIIVIIVLGAVAYFATSKYPFTNEETQQPRDSAIKLLIVPIYYDKSLEIQTWTNEEIWDEYRAVAKEFDANIQLTDTKQRPWIELVFPEKPCMFLDDDPYGDWGNDEYGSYVSRMSGGLYGVEASVDVYITIFCPTNDKEIEEWKITIQNTFNELYNNFSTNFQYK